MNRRTFIKAGTALPLLAAAAPGFSPPRCRVVPQPDHQTAFLVRNRERLRWHFGAAYPRPFFYPLRGPSGKPLTRLGHPGAPDHDHHRSIWFAHHDVNGANFWSEGTGNTIRQQAWLCYEDGEREAVMAVRLVWNSGRDLLAQELVAALRPESRGELLLELQSRFHAIRDPVRLGKTHFGILGVRVAKSLSVHFGGGVITSSEGVRGEQKIFGTPARWMDYSGPIGTDPGDQPVIEGITLFDHPANPGHPVRWHVREDGWMGPSLCRAEPLTITREQPLTVRYLLHAHTGGCLPGRANQLAEQFKVESAWRVEKDPRPHRQYRVVRKNGNA